MLQMCAEKACLVKSRINLEGAAAECVAALIGYF